MHVRSTLRALLSTPAGQLIVLIKLIEFRETKEFTHDPHERQHKKNLFFPSKGVEKGDV